MKINSNLSLLRSTSIRLNGRSKAFTLVELIVVITILAILGTIAFISLQGYSRDARDSTRAADLGNMKTSLELFSLKTGQYPKPDNFTTITSSGDTVWYQGIVGDQVTINLKSLNEKPLDPLLNIPYIYSTTSSFKEYEVLALYEGSVASIISQANAAGEILTPKVVGTYNGVYVQTIKYIIPTPSIITSESGDLVLTGTTIRSQVITNGTNIPKIGSLQAKTGSLTLGTFTIAPKINKNSTDTEKITAINAIQDTYTGSNIATQENIFYILNQTSTGKILDLVNITLLKGQKNLTSNNATPTPPPPSKKSVLDCGISTGIIYGTSDGTDVGLTCSDDIVVCNGTTGSGYTILACNVGATAVALSDNSNKITSYGGLYQWGNNYDFRGGQFTDGLVYSPTTTTQITTAQNYTTYTSNIFVKGVTYWTFHDLNGLLRSAQWNVCPTGYHIPTQPEWNSIFTPTLLGTTQTAYGITNQLKIPAAGYRYWFNASLLYQGSYGFYLSSSPNNLGIYIMGVYPNGIYPNNSGNHTDGSSVRCFKN